jgi:hypothetical protein
MYGINIERETTDNESSFHPAASKIEREMKTAQQGVINYH